MHDNAQSFISLAMVALSEWSCSNDITSSKCVSDLGHSRASRLLIVLSAREHGLMTARWWHLCIVLVRFWGCLLAEWNVGGRKLKWNCANLNCQDTEWFVFLRKETFPYLTKKKGRKEAASSFFQGSCNSGNYVSSCYQIVLGHLLLNMGGCVPLALPFKFILLKWSIAQVSADMHRVRSIM